MKIILGSRGSQLALAQAELVKRAFEQTLEKPEISIQIIKTTGDQHLEIRLNKPGPSIPQGLFTKELEEALLRREIDIAVHSLKDLPTEIPADLQLAGVLPRHDPVDLLISKTARSLADVPLHSIVATSSNRRGRQLRFRRPDLIISEIRGNVPTRLFKLLQNEHWNAIILAKAGLERLGYRLEQGLMEYESQALFASDLVELLPAVGQGAIGLEVASWNREVRMAIEQINDHQTWFCVNAERELLRMVGGGCQTPLGVRTRLRQNVLHFDAILFGKEGKPVTGTISDTFLTPAAAATALFTSIYGRQK